MSSLKTTVTEHQEMTEFGPMTTHRTVSHSSCSQCQNMFDRISLLEKKLGVAVEALEQYQKSMVPHPKLHPAMYKAWIGGKQTLETIRNLHDSGDQPTGGGGEGEGT